MTYYQMTTFVLNLYICSYLICDNIVHESRNMMTSSSGDCGVPAFQVFRLVGKPSAMQASFRLLAQRAK